MYCTVDLAAGGGPFPKGDLRLADAGLRTGMNTRRAYAVFKEGGKTTKEEEMGTRKQQATTCKPSTSWWRATPPSSVACFMCILIVSIPIVSVVQAVVVISIARIVVIVVAVGSGCYVPAATRSASVIWRIVVPLIIAAWIGSMIASVAIRFVVITHAVARISSTVPRILMSAVAMAASIIITAATSRTVARVVPRAAATVLSIDPPNVRWSFRSFRSF